jgi:hypothetical protein
MDLMTRLQNKVIKQGIGTTAILAATNPTTVVACVFNPVLAVAVVAGVAATVKACEVTPEDIEVDLDTIASVDYFASLEAKVNAPEAISIQYNDEPEVVFDADAELEAMKKELYNDEPEVVFDAELEAMKKELFGNV